MSQTLVKNYVHIIFSTRNRRPMIIPSIEAELHQYIGGVCKALNCTPIKVGGYIDHIHILCMLSKNTNLSNLLKEIKVNSSKWIKSKVPSLNQFYWQEGYGAFSVKPSETEGLIKYIHNQHVHHNSKSFEKEFTDYLKDLQVAYDERYLWN